MEKNIFGISPEIMEQAKKLGECFTIEIRKHRDEGRVEVRYIPTNPCSYVDIGAMVDELSNQLAWGHAAAFSMKGTIGDAD